MLGYRNVGVQKCWDIEMMGYRNAGVYKCWDIEMPWAAFLGEAEQSSGVSSGKEPVLSAGGAGAGLGWL